MNPASVPTGLDFSPHNIVRLCSARQLDVFEAAERYQRDNIPLIILAGKDYGSGNSRDWVAKGPYLLVNNNSKASESTLSHGTAPLHASRSGSARHSGISTGDRSWRLVHVVIRTSVPARAPASDMSLPTECRSVGLCHVTGFKGHHKRGRHKPLHMIHSDLPELLDTSVVSSHRMNRTSFRPLF